MDLSWVLVSTSHGYWWVAIISYIFEVKWRKLPQLVGAQAGSLVPRSWVRLVPKTLLHMWGSHRGWQCAPHTRVTLGTPQDPGRASRQWRCACKFVVVWSWVTSASQLVGNCSEMAASPGFSWGLGSFRARRDTDILKARSGETVFRTCRCLWPMMLPPFPTACPGDLYPSIKRKMTVKA